MNDKIKKKSRERAITLSVLSATCLPFGLHKFYLGLYQPLIDFEINNIPVSVLNPDVDQSKNYNTNTDIFITYKDDKALTVFTENLKKL